MGQGGRNWRKKNKKVSFGTCLPPATRHSHHPNLCGLSGLSQTTARQKNKHSLPVFIVVMGNELHPNTFNTSASPHGEEFDKTLLVRKADL